MGVPVFFGSRSPGAESSPRGIAAPQKRVHMPSVTGFDAIGANRPRALLVLHTDDMRWCNNGVVCVSSSAKQNNLRLYEKEGHDHIWAEPHSALPSVQSTPNGPPQCCNNCVSAPTGVPDNPRHLELEPVNKGRLDAVTAGFGTAADVNGDIAKRLDKALDSKPESASGEAIFKRGESD